MQAMTVRDTGAEGIYLALSDGMKAAAYARQLDASQAANDRLTAENSELRRTVARQAAELNRLRKQNRYYRFSRSRAYAQVLEGQAHGGRGLVALALVGLGAVLMCGVSIAVVCLAGV